MAFKWHFWSKIVAGFHRNHCHDSNWDSDFESEFDLYRKLVKFNQNWSKMNIFPHFPHCFWYQSTFIRLLRSFNQVFWSVNRTFWSFYWSSSYNVGLYGKKRYPKRLQRCDGSDGKIQDRKVLDLFPPEARKIENYCSCFWLVALEPIRVKSKYWTYLCK